MRMMWTTAILLVGAGALSARAATPEQEEALANAKRRMSAAVNGCYTSSGAAQYAAGRVELFVQAHAGELVNVVVNSELNNPDFSTCVCTRSLGALTAWTATVEQDDAVTLPYILSPNSGQPGQTYPKSAHTCSLAPAPGSGSGSAPPEESRAPTLPGHVTLSKLKTKGVEAGAAQGILDGVWGEVERCYQADLIRYEGYTAEAKLELLLSGEGKVSAVRLDGLAHNSISSCQIQHLMGLSFPTGGAAGRVRARLSYTPGE